MWLEIIILAVLIDFVVREPPGTLLNPVVLAGGMMNRTWRIFKHQIPAVEKLNGFVFAMTFISLSTFLTYLLLSSLDSWPLLQLFASALILKYCIAVSAFFDTAGPVAEALGAGDLQDARNKVRHLVTRETSGLDEKRVVSAAVESVGENICDALISPLFYFALFGVPGAVAARVINLLDGCVGYRTPEKKNIGWFSARLDDLVQFIPARLSSLLIALSALMLRKNFWNSLKTAVKDHSKDDGINSGWTIAAMAGALNVQLEKPGAYRMGMAGDELNVRKINDALLFIPASLALFIILSILVKGVA
jgi:adenosylcobinamide-phosphate synthase